MVNDRPTQPHNLAALLRFLVSSYPDQWARMFPQRDEEQRRRAIQGTLDAYMMLLQDVPFDLLLAATLEYVGSHSWFPKIDQLRQAAFGLRDKAVGVPTAEQAMAELQAQISAVGSWGVPRWSHTNIGAAVDAIGGWSLICQSEIESWPSTRARFLDCYHNIEQRRQSDERMLPDVQRAVAQLAATMTPRLGNGKDTHD